MANIIVFMRDGQITEVVHNIEDAVVDVVDRTTHITDDQGKIMPINDEPGYVRTKEFGDYDPKYTAQILLEMKQGFAENDPS